MKPVDQMTDRELADELLDDTRMKGLWHWAVTHELTGRATKMGYDNSWSYAKYLAGEVGTASTTTAGLVPKEKACRCESHYLFCWGHEKQCDYYEDKK